MTLLIAATFAAQAHENTAVAQESDIKAEKSSTISAERIGIKLVQAHSPMGKPISDDNSAFLADTIRCVDACGAWGIPNLGEVHSGSIRLL